MCPSLPCQVRAHVCFLASMNVVFASYACGFQVKGEGTTMLCVCVHSTWQGRPCKRGEGVRRYSEEGRGTGSHAGPPLHGVSSKSTQQVYTVQGVSACRSSELVSPTPSSQLCHKLYTAIQGDPMQYGNRAKA
jgi:hypothetical protein